MSIKRENNAWETEQGNDEIQQLTNLAKIEKDNCSDMKKIITFKVLSKSKWKFRFLPITLIFP